MSTYDTLKCGNCGYDSGVAHLKEEMKLYSRIAGLEKELAEDPETRQLKIIAMGIVTIFMTLILTLGAASIFSAPDQITKTEQHIHPTSVGTAYEKVSSNYRYCLSKAYEKDERMHCADTLGDMQKSLLDKLNEEKMKSEK